MRSVRTASGSDRIICHFPFSIFHFPIVGQGAMTNESSKWPMVNGKWKMIRSLPLAVLTLKSSTDVSILATVWREYFG
ncbi:MAG: hypothetical protein DMF74_13410 [Acidobacteria bacterium]|nr:MAG: hypothetical protein DMF74_13410 [Acidobacteriota bacterium]